MKISKIAVAMICVCVLLGTTCFAVGNISAWVSHTDNRGIEDYNAALQWMEKAGMGSKMPQEFGNGYTFSELCETVSTAVDENNNPLSEHTGASITYNASDRPPIGLDIEPETMEEPAEGDFECRMIGGREVSYRQYTFKTVPTDYKLTAQDEKDMLRDDFMLSYGSDIVEIQDLRMCCWTEDGFAYTLIAFDSDIQPDEWFEMAAEVIG